MAKIIALVNQKGGVGKTTSAINLGAALSMEGKRVLLVDLDPQGNMTISLGVHAHKLRHTIYERLSGDCETTDAILPGAYDLLPADLRLSAAELELTSQPGREMLLREALEPIAPQYDYILIDCPPSLGLITLNGLTAAQEIIIPLQAEFLALNGVAQLLRTISAVKKRLNPQLEITGILTTLYDHRKNLNREVLEKIKEHFPDQTFAGVIRDNVALAEAPSFGKDIFAYRPDSAGAEDYKAISRELISREGKK